MQMWREEYHVLYSISLGPPLETSWKKGNTAFLLPFNYGGSEVPEKILKIFAHKCPADLFEACFWSQTFMLTSSAGSSFSSGWASICCVDLSFTHLFHHGSLQPSDLAPFQSQTSELLTILSPLSCDKCHFLSLTHSFPVLFTGLPLTGPSGLSLVIMCPPKPSMNSEIMQVVLLWPLIVFGTSSSLQLSPRFVIFSKLKGVSL